MMPGPRVLEYPVLLDSDTIQLRAYPIESALAEKLQAMVALGSANSRMKDFYDVWICSNHLDFDTDTLLDAIGATFKKSGNVRTCRRLRGVDGKFRGPAPRTAERLHEKRWARMNSRMRSASRH